MKKEIKAIEFIDIENLSILTSSTDEHVIQFIESLKNQDIFLKSHKFKRTFINEFAASIEFLFIAIKSYGKHNHCDFNNFETVIDEQMFEDLTLMNMKNIVYLRDTLKVFDKIINVNGFYDYVKKHY